MFGILSGKDWEGRQQQVAQAIVGDLRKGLGGYPGILKHIDNVLAESIGEMPVPPQAPPHITT
jgi:hypothetical protein